MAKNDVSKKRGSDVNLRVSATLLPESGREGPEAVAYAFSSSGHLLAHDALREGTATLRLASAEEAQGIRVVIGPKVDAEEPRLSELLRRGAVEESVRLDPDDKEAKIELPIPPDIWRCWQLGLCVVRGRLQKRAASGGVNIESPVCGARVEVYEVDPWSLVVPRLPDNVIERLREQLLYPKPIPDPRPPVEVPFPRPAPDPTPAFLGMMAQRASAPTMSATQRTEPMSVPSDLQFLARSTDTAQLRNALLDHAQLVRPILCHFFPRFVRMDLVATATTDDCGRFRAFFFKGCTNPDKPDLYFKATQRILPFPFPPVTILAQTPVSCHTYWNYVCGSEVALYTTHPLARTCPPCPNVEAENNWVLFMAVGNHPLSLIHGTGQSLQGSTNATNVGLTETGAPWGGLLRPRLEFDASLRHSLGVKYYRVSWRKGTSGDFQALDREVIRHYTHEVGDDLVLEVYPLGPKVVGDTANLFEIPPALPPTGQWTQPDMVENSTSAKFPTVDHVPAAQAGKVQLKVDLFDGAGAPVDIAAKNIRYVVPTSTDLTGTIQTVDASTLGLVSGNSFVMTLHVDNNPCTASISPPTLNGTPADDDCGVLRYDTQSPGSVSMPFTADHPNDFASYNFSVHRGVNKVLDASGPVAAGTPTLSEPVETLLGGCAVAGFSENLYVSASATNGWRNLSEYDRADVRAFVLAPLEQE